VLVAPLIEEGIKRIHPFVKHLFIWVEFASYLLDAAETIHAQPKLLFPIVGIRLAVAAAHYYWARLSYKRGVLGQALWNLMVLIQ